MNKFIPNLYITMDVILKLSKCDTDENENALDNQEINKHFLHQINILRGHIDVCVLLDSVELTPQIKWINKAFKVSDTCPCYQRSISISDRGVVDRIHGDGYLISSNNEIFESNNKIEFLKVDDIQSADLAFNRILRDMVKHGYTYFPHLNASIQHQINTLDHGDYVTEESMIAYHLNELTDDWETAYKLLIVNLGNSVMSDESVEFIRQCFNLSLTTSNG